MGAFFSHFKNGNQNKILWFKGKLLRDRWTVFELWLLWDLTGVEGNNNRESVRNLKK